MLEVWSLHLIISIGTFIMQQINHSRVLHPPTPPKAFSVQYALGCFIGVHLEMIEKKMEKRNQQKRARHEYTMLGDDEKERTKSVAQKWNSSTTVEPFL
jgi:hypothetical protein